MAMENNNNFILERGFSQNKIKINSSNIRDVSFKEYLLFWFYEIHQYQVGNTTKTIAHHALNKYILPNIDSYTRVCFINGKYIDDIIHKVRQSVESAITTHSSSIPELVYRFLYGAFRYADETKLIQNNPMLEATRVQRVPPKNIKLLNTEEIKKLLSVAKNTRSSYGEVLLALFNGLRKGEIYGLSPNDFDFQKKTVYIQSQRVLENCHPEEGHYHGVLVKKPPKTTSSVRLLRVHDYVLDAIKDRIKLNEENKIKYGSAYVDNDTVFCNKYGAPFSGSQFNLALSKACSRAGIAHCSCHSLRHTFATMLLEQGENIQTISRLLGHTSETTTFVVYCSMIEGGRQVSDALDKAYQFPTTSSAIMDGGGLSV